MSVSFLKALPAPLGHVLHIGAGQGGDLSAYLDAGAQAVTLVEPDPEALVHLRQLAKDDPRVTVIGAAISVDQDAAGLHRFNFPDLNSLRPTETLEALFPGLEELGCEPVPLQTPSALLSVLEMPAGQAHVLVIEAPGEAMSILQALAKADLLQQFSGVSIHGSAKVRYRDEEPIGKIASWLRTVGFPDAQEDASEDPDFPHIHVARNVQLDALGALEEERDKAVAEAAAQKQKAIEARREKGRIQARLTREKKKTSKAEEELTEAQARLAVLEPLEAQVKELQVARDTVQQKLVQRNATLSETQARIAVLEPLEAQVSELQAARDKAQQQLAAQQATLTEAQARIAALEPLEAQVSELQAARDTVQQKLVQRNATLSETQARVVALEPLEAQVSEMQAAQDKAQQKLAELRTALSEAQARKATVAEKLSKTEKQVAELEAERTGLKEQLATARQAAQKYETQAAHVAVSREEILRAEGQIDLIKDLLLRGQDL